MKKFLIAMFSIILVITSVSCNLGVNMENLYDFGTRVNCKDEIGRYEFRVIYNPEYCWFGVIGLSGIKTNQEFEESVRLSHLFHDLEKTVPGHTLEDLPKYYSNAEKALNDIRDELTYPWYLTWTINEVE